VPLVGDKTPRPIAETRATESRGRWSADGAWIAYESNETGRTEVFVQSFQSPLQRAQVSTSGGLEPIWSGDGQELFFRTPDERLMSVRAGAGRNWLRPEGPQFLFRLPPGPRRFTSGTYAPAADGQRFLVNLFVEPMPPVTVLLNWRPRR
jgi:hypothetical protein